MFLYFSYFAKYSLGIETCTKFPNSTYSIFCTTAISCNCEINALSLYGINNSSSRCCCRKNSSICFNKESIPIRFLAEIYN